MFGQVDLPDAAFAQHESYLKIFDFGIGKFAGIFFGEHFVFGEIEGLWDFVFGEFEELAVLFVLVLQFPLFIEGALTHESWHA